MRGMKRQLLRAAVALILGMLVAAVMTSLPIHRVDRGQGARISTIYRGHDGWYIAHDEVFGLTWFNLQLMDAPLIEPLEEGELPRWAEPPRDAPRDVPMYRVATLASGWPFLGLRMRWTVTGTSQNFPIPAELDDQDTSIAYAAEDFRLRNRGGGPGEIGILWSGALANVAAYAVIAFALLGLRDRLRRPRSPGHSAGSLGSSTITTR